MKKQLFLGLLAVLFIAATYNEGGTFALDGLTVATVDVISSRVRIQTEYYSLYIKEGECKSADIYSFCIDSLEDDEVEFYPHHYRINLTYSKLCTTCAGYGGKCTDDTQCENHCVHGACRPTTTWCPDTYCDAQEACVADCPEQNLTNTTNETNTAAQVSVVVENVTINETNASTTSAISNDVTEEQETQVDTQAKEELPSTDSLAAVKTSSQSPLPSHSSEKQTNWVGASIVLLLGLCGIIYVFMRARKKRKENTLLSLPPTE